MKKIIKFSCVAIAVAAAGYGGVKAYDAYNSAPSTDVLLSENVLALSEVTEPKYYRSEGDCSLTVSGGAEVALMLGNIKITSVKANANGEVVFEGVKIVCSANGDTMCTPRECAEFWIDIINASADDDDKSGDKDKNEKKEKTENIKDGKSDNAK